MDEQTREAIGRVHARVDEIEKSVLRQEIIVGRMEKSQEAFVGKIEKAVYGNGKDGIITKISNLFTELRIHFKLISLLIVGLLTEAFFVVRSMFIK